MRRVLLTYRCGFIALGLILAATTLACGHRRVISVEQVNQIINEQVPVGSDRQQIKTFIENLKVDSLRIVHDSDFHQAAHDLIGTLDTDKTDALGDRIAEFIGARIVAVETGFWYQEDIRIEFYLDKGGRMIDYTVKEVGEE